MEYNEKHHIVPRCLGGKDNQENIVVLTPEEHYLAHQLLIKMYPDNHKLLYAAHMMTVENKDIASVSRPNNKLYGWVKRKVSKAKSIQRTGYKHSEETKAKIGAAHKGRWIGRTVSNNTREKLRQANYRRVYKPMSGSQKEKMRIAALGRQHTDETRAKISESITGRKHSEETKAKMRKPKSPEMRAKLSAARKGKKFPRFKVDVDLE